MAGNLHPLEPRRQSEEQDAEERAAYHADLFGPATDAHLLRIAKFEEHLRQRRFFERLLVVSLLLLLFSVVFAAVIVWRHQK